MFFNKKKYILLTILLIIHYFAPSITNTNYLLSYDVSQGDSTLLRLNNKTVLIDTGGGTNKEYSQDIITNLKSEGIRKIDYLILTHGDLDHMGESINLVNNYKVDKVIFNCDSYNDLEIELISVLKNKHINYYSCLKELKIGNNKLLFLNTNKYDNENDNSNVIYLEFNNYKILLMGDAGINKEKDIINKYNLNNIDILKVGHHGSNTSSSKSFINSINPKYSIISVGKNNRYGHPHKEVINNLSNSKIYRTDRDGSIIFKLNNKLNIKTNPP